MPDDLLPLYRELDLWAHAGLTARLWLRDDDAVAATPALDTYTGLLREHDAHALIAAIPALIEPTLSPALAAQPHWRVAVHGWHHTNHAPPPARASEFADDLRDAVQVEVELTRGLDIIRTAFSTQALAVFVPPWNRMGSRIAAQLALLGYTGLSAFADLHSEAASRGFAVANTHADLMRWRQHRGGRPLSEVASTLADALAASRLSVQHPIGVLTHHLVHDAAANRVLATLLGCIANHPAARWITPAEVFTPRLASTP